LTLKGCSCTLTRAKKMTDIEPVKVEVLSGRIGELPLEENNLNGGKKEEQFLMEDKAKHGK
jgi:hypothetical protein